LARELKRALVLVVLVVLALASVGTGGPAWPLANHQQRSDVTFAAALDGQRLDLSSSGDPIVLDPDRSSVLALVIRNNTGLPLTVRQVPLRGKAVGITLLAYDVTINAFIQPGDGTKLNVPVEFVDLGQQADGLLPATLRLISSDRSELASRDFTVDVRGSPMSLMTVFTLVVAIATGVSIAAIWIAIGRRRLQRTRWRRGLRFALVGAGVGVTLTLFLAELLLVTPKGAVWIPLLVIPTGGAFLLGWFSPGPLEDEEAEIEAWMRETVPQSK